MEINRTTVGRKVTEVEIVLFEAGENQPGTQLLVWIKKFFNSIKIYMQQSKKKRNCTVWEVGKNVDFYGIHAIIYRKTIIRIKIGYTASKLVKENKSEENNFKRARNEKK